jgi:diadenosine tetraphosphate (Ap4A) HIT family hydrolase
LDPCPVCTALEEPGRGRELWIHHDDLVLLGHVAPSTGGLKDGYPGHLLLVPNRHVESPGALTDEEGERIGRWLARGSRLLEAVRKAEHVYLLRLGDGWPHLHFHFIPRYPGTPEEYRGIEVRDWPGVPRYDWEEIAAAAAELRRAAQQER